MRCDPDVHHRQSIRLKGYDYAWAGAYFVTVCVQGRESLLGEVVGGEMVRNKAGEMVRQTWLGLGERFPNLTIDEFVAMPNHCHGILFLTDRRGESCIRPNGSGKGRGESCIRPMDQNDRNIQDDHKLGDHKDRPYGTSPDSVGRIVQAFKSLTTVEYARGVAHNDWPPFNLRLWQRNYFERIIRNDYELARARKYIEDNPLQWHLDAENPANIP